MPLVPRVSSFLSLTAWRQSERARHDVPQEYRVRRDSIPSQVLDRMDFDHFVDLSKGGFGDTQLLSSLISEKRFPSIEVDIKLTVGISDL